MLNKNLHLIFLILLMGAIFTGVILILFKINLLIGSLATFLLIVVLTLILLKEMIEQKYNLLSDLPSKGQTVKPFQFITFGKIVWQYPPEGEFIFDFDESQEKAGELSTPPELPLSSQKTKEFPVENDYEMEVRIFPRSNRGRKSDRTDEEWDTLVKEYLSLGNYEKQAAFCQRHHIGSPRTFRNHVRKYKEKHGYK